MLDKPPHRKIKTIVLLLSLTGGRRGEVPTARFAAFDLDQRVWHLPKTESGRAPTDSLFGTRQGTRCSGALPSESRVVHRTSKGDPLGGAPGVTRSDLTLRPLRGSRCRARSYKISWLKATPSIMPYLASFLLFLVDVRLPVIHGGGWGAVLRTGFIALIASLNFAVDLERIGGIEDRQMPSVGAWYVALATTTTFVWLYISILRLVARVRGA